MRNAATHQRLEPSILLSVGPERWKWQPALPVRAVGRSLVNAILDTLALGNAPCIGICLVFACGLVKDPYAFDAVSAGRPSVWIRLNPAGGAEDTPTGPMQGAFSAFCSFSANGEQTERRLTRPQRCTVAAETGRACSSPQRSAETFPTAAHTHLQLVSKRVV